ncbi:ATP-dependent helicase [Streptomyces asoensis]|uniref:ATP-dependent helicase n=1 Tax=Streptomyces asoensis TaxID=249586 RepID=UPI0036A659A8
MQFTKAQAEAIATTDQNLLIVACAGSGKTEVLSRRIAGLLGKPGLDGTTTQPKHIVAFTFTEKAAGELKERVYARIKSQHGEVNGLAEMYIGTMHGYALDLLHSHVPEAFKYNVLNDVQTRLIIDKNSAKSGLTATSHVVQGVEKPLRRYIHSKLYQQAMSILREDDVDIDGLRPDVKEGLDKYQELLAARRYFDYTAILLNAVTLLEGDDDEADSILSLRKHIRDSVRYVVVDEYQDTNPIQERLIRGLTQFGANLCVVGDDDQTIYQWRGSAVANILNVEDRYKDVARVTLNENFRSSPAIVELARTYVDRIPDEHRLPKQMVAAGHQSFDLGDILAVDFADQQEEARWIVDRIETLRGVPFADSSDAPARGMTWSDNAVLFRSVKADAGPLVEELRSRGVPYVIKGLTKLFETPEVLAACSLFRYAASLVDAGTVVDTWLAADLALTETDLRAAISRVLDKAMMWDSSRPWDATTLQGTFLDFLEAVGLREESVPGDRGELVYYNLGRFSTAIGDYEKIFLTSTPQDRFTSFASWLENQAPNYYAEADRDTGYAQPDAVVIATVHQAKGMQWPAVYLPALRKNTFPSRASGGTNIFHIIERELVPDADRYRGGEEDERRLFYVAATRAQKYLALSFASNGKATGKAQSIFFTEATRVSTVLTREIAPATPQRLTPAPRRGTPDVVMSFSDLKYLFECPYSFKLRLLYGFDSPLQKEIGYGKSLHDAMAEIHKRAIEGDYATPGEAEELVDRHLNLPFANIAAYEQLRPAAISSVQRYLRENSATLRQTVYSEQPVEIHPASGVTVIGRVDLIKRLDSEMTSIVDFKSTERAQAEDLTRDQLHLYALGYRELTGHNADLVEVLNLDKVGKSTRETVDPRHMDSLTQRVAAAGDALRTNVLPRLPVWCASCASCDHAGICRKREN